MSYTNPLTKYFLNKAEGPSVTNQKYGVIKTSIIKYVTPTMVFVLLMCVALVVFNFDTLRTNYETNIPLNSLIFIVFFMAMVEAFNNNINVYNTARFFKRMEHEIQAPVVDDASILYLKRMLDTSAYLVNTQNSFNLLTNLQKFGHPLVTDNDARIIKSKLGYRIRAQRSSVSFMGGLLVMLGLIGTFWGLLGTISAVGEAMDVIASQADSLGSSEGGGGMGNIIQSISAPLQGMGLAFSSSLFGLAGSLIVGFFNHSCSQAQDRAIEDFSRWIDENIPIVGSEEEKFLKFEEASQSKTTEGSGQASDSDSQGVGDRAPAAEAKLGFDERGPLEEGMATQVMYTLKQSIDSQTLLSDNFEKLLNSQNATYDIMLKQTESLNDVFQVNQELLTANGLGNELVSEQIGQMSSVLDAHSKTNTALHRIAEQMREDFDLNKEIKAASYEVISQNENMHVQLQSVDNNMQVLQSQLSDINLSIHSSQDQFLSMQNIVGEGQKAFEVVSSDLSDIKDHLSKNDLNDFHGLSVDISENITVMQVLLKENVAAMKAIAEAGNMDRMARILKEMQVFWLQMKHSALEVVKKSTPDDKDGVN